MTTEECTILVFSASIAGFALGYTMARIRIAKLRKASLFMRLDRW